MKRRTFLKNSALCGTSAVLAAGAGAAVTQSSNRDARASTAPGTESKKRRFSLFSREYDSIDDAYEIAADYRRMDHKNIIFARWAWDPKYYKPGGMALSFLAKASGQVADPLRHEKQDSPVAKALSRAAWAGHDDGAWLSNGGLRSKGPLNQWDKFSKPAVENPYAFNSPEEAKKYIKRSARFLGADEVGIAPYDERWTYTKEFDMMDVFDRGLDPIDAAHQTIEFPFEVKSVIAFTLEMDYDALKCGGHINDCAVGLEYSRMTEVGHKLSVFLNHLGYKAIPSGNDTGLSIPIAIQAGLGEISRMGTMVSERYGSRVRIGKVYTDLELPPDRVKSFGVQEFCIKCKKCAELCPSNAIGLEAEPTVKPTVSSISSNPGVRKWYQDNEKCFSQWERLGTGCGVCITVCPYNKIENWVHDLSRMVVGAPIGRDIARQLDDAFGYGKMGPQHVDSFWDDAG